MWSNLVRLAGSPISTPKKDKGKNREDPLITFTSTWETLKSTLNSAIIEGISLKQSNVIQLLQQLLELLSNETSSTTTYSSSPGSLGPCLEFILKSGVLSTLSKLVLKDEPVGVRAEVIKWYGQAIVELDEMFLIHSAVSTPLIKLLRGCVDQDGGLARSEEVVVVDVMCTICQRIRSFPELLVIFFREKSSSTSRRGTVNPHTGESYPERSSSPTPSTSTISSTTSYNPSSIGSSTHPRRKTDHDFLLFSYLLRFVHREGRVGDFARAGLLFLIDIAMSSSPSASTSTSMHRIDTSETVHPSLSSTSASTSPPAHQEATLALAEYLLDSNFAEVLAAGLGALYGLLPGKLVVRSAGEVAALNSPSQNESWNDSVEIEGAGGMVLGGMGPLGEEEDSEAAQIRREEEETRLKVLGVGISGTEEFREGLDGWLKLVEFTQDVLRRAPASTSIESFDSDQLEDDTRQLHLLTSALISSILSSIRLLFLQNVLYPSILECSEGDGSAVAVLSYLDALLGVVEEGTKLEFAILEFLMGDEDISELKRQERPIRLRTPRQFNGLNNLVIIESSASNSRAAQQAADSSTYFSSLGRFSLKDLLVSNVHSTSQPTALAALKLLQTMLARHDRWSMGLLDVVLDEGATSFPLALMEEPEMEETDEVEEESVFVYQSGDISDAESDVFVYPSSTVESCSPTTPKGRNLNQFTSPSISTPSRNARLILGSPLPASTSITQDDDSLDTLLSLITAIDPSYRSTRAAGGGSEILSSGFANYLEDAEHSIASNLAFQRGMSASSGSDTSQEVKAELSPQVKRKTLFGGPSLLTARDYASAKTMFRHRLLPESPLLSLVLDSLSHFFSHSPDLNLALTGVVTSLMVCPYRSLEGWMLPKLLVEKVGIQTLAELVERDKERTMRGIDSDGDDRSVDYNLDERIQQQLLSTPSTSRVSIKPLSHSLLSILSALTNSVSHYRATIPKFDVYLSERRQGLMFVENLTDALDLDLGSDGNSFGEAVKSIERKSTPSANSSDFSTPVKQTAKPISRSFGAFLSPRTNMNTVPTSPPPQYTEVGSISTPPRLPSKSPTTTGNSKSDNAPASPFAAHYKETGSISVRPVIVDTTPSALARSSRSLGFEEDEEVNVKGPFDSPTRRLSPLPPPLPSTPSVMSEEGGESSFGGSPSEGGRKKNKKNREVQDVTLSAILDNTLVLEEFLKELSSVALVRRQLGIDSVRFI